MCHGNMMRANKLETAVSYQLSWDRQFFSMIFVWWFSQCLYNYICVYNGHHDIIYILPGPIAYSLQNSVMRLFWQNMHPCWQCMPRLQVSGRGGLHSGTRRLPQALMDSRGVEEAVSQSIIRSNLCIQVSLCFMFTVWCGLVGLAFPWVLLGLLYCMLCLSGKIRCILGFF